MKDSIEISKKYGLNPSMCLCPVCLKEINEIALLGHNRGREAPRYIIGQTPCKECNDNLKHGYVACIGVEEEDHSKRTGDLIFIEQNVLSKLLGDNYKGDKIIMVSLAFINKINELLVQYN